MEIVSPLPDLRLVLDDAKAFATIMARELALDEDCRALIVRVTDATGREVMSVRVGDAATRRRLAAIG
jgi:hypothetical protein